jgi:hypothetical protein
VAAAAQPLIYSRTNAPFAALHLQRRIDAFGSLVNQRTKLRSGFAGDNPLACGLGRLYGRDLNVGIHKNSFIV